MTAAKAGTLRERVARAMAQIDATRETQGGPLIVQHHGEYEHIADAAIALCREEFSALADDIALEACGDCIGMRIADAIRDHEVGK